MTFNNLRAVRRIPAQAGAYIVTVDLDLGDGPEAAEYGVVPGGGGLCDALLAEIAAGRFAGEITDDAPQLQPPDSLPRTAFWLYLLAQGLTRADIHAALDAMLAADQITADHAARLRIKIDDAASYHRADPDLLLMAQAMGIAADQAALDAHFLAAVSG